jgi:hypothetical protein
MDGVENTVEPKNTDDTTGLIFCELGRLCNASKTSRKFLGRDVNKTIKTMMMITNRQRG